ncbi:hypothetical protein LENED_002352 [Lentinula edodes]|uniref:Uncharacterized protein n=1 Tax=Lentinula edodes TaxID=5353 RepID=A0A1Q3E0M3_LENED|nr:hypothetical protein LENED_002352 [Lentinula edodes]
MHDNWQQLPGFKIRDVQIKRYASSNATFDLLFNTYSYALALYTVLSQYAHHPTSGYLEIVLRTPVLPVPMLLVWRPATVNSSDIRLN